MFPSTVVCSALLYLIHHIINKIIFVFLSSTIINTPVTMPPENYKNTKKKNLPPKKRNTNPTTPRKETKGKKIINLVPSAQPIPPFPKVSTGPVSLPGLLLRRPRPPSLSPPPRALGT
jgi:hypothetical protein